MLSTQFVGAVVAATTINQIDNIVRLAWKAWGEGHLSDADVEATQSAVESRRASIRAKVYLPSKRLSATPRRRPVRDRQKSITRRRTLAASGVVPNRIAAHFTQGETAVLTVVAREAKKQRHHRCELPIDAIAAMAGVCRTLVQNAFAEARRLGIISIIERPRPGQRSLTNIVTIKSPEWRNWLRLGGRVHKSKHHGITKDSLLGMDTEKGCAQSTGAYDSRQRVADSPKRGNRSNSKEGNVMSA